MRDNVTPAPIEIPHGYCLCGCGGKTNLARKTSTTEGAKKGEPRRFIHGHHARKSNSPVEWNEEIGAYTVGLTRGRFAIIDAVDVDRVSQYRWITQLHEGDRAYAVGTVNSRLVKMHRIITGAPDGLHVDHIDGNGLNNRRENLRLCKHSENAKNQRINSRNTSGYTGVVRHSRNEGKWIAKITADGVNYYVGTFDTAEEAARARDKKAREVHGEFARLNFPDHD